MPVIWVIEDLVVLLVATITLVFVLRKEEKPVQILLELFCFILFYAGAYENLGTILPLYHYGRSLIMIANVPITVPIIEYLVVYSSLRMLGKMRIPTWCKPIVVGLFGMLQDFTLDPLAVRQVFETAGGSIGRWSWVVGPRRCEHLGDPRFRTSRAGCSSWGGGARASSSADGGSSVCRRPLVGWVYPVLSMLGALLLLVSPVSQFLLWLAPFFPKGSPIEWMLLAVHCAVALSLLAVAWRGRMNGRLTVRGDLPVFLVPVVFHVSDLVFTLVAGYTEILWLELLFTAVHWVILLAVVLRGRGIRLRAEAKTAAG